MHYGFFEDAKNISMDTNIYADTKRENDKYAIFYVDAKSCRTKKKIFPNNKSKNILYLYS